MVCVLSAYGCTKKSNPPAAPQEPTKTAAQYKAEADKQKRFSIYERVQEISARDLPVSALYYELAPYASRDSITGLKQRVTYQPTLEQIRLRG